MAVNAALDDEKQAGLDFDAGFNLDTPPPEKVTAIPEPETKVDETPAPKAEPKAATKAAPKTEPVPEAPKYVQVTQEQFDNLQSSASKTAAMEAQLSKVFGTMGQMQQVVTRLQSVTPAGQSIELPKNSFAKIRESYPDLADLLESDMSEALKGVRGTGPAEAAGAVADPEAVSKLVQAAAIKNEMDALEDAHPNWREIVGTVDNEGKHDPSIPFRKWLATQDAAYSAKINATNSSAIISRAIDKFLESTKATPAPAESAPKIAARNDRIRGAIQPKGDGGQPAPANTAETGFDEGFRTG